MNFLKWIAFYRKLAQDYTKRRRVVEFYVVFYILALFATMIVFYGYLEMSGLWAVYGGVVFSKKYLWIMEIPLFLMATLLLATPVPGKKETLKMSMSAGLAMFFPYIGIDVFFPFQYRSVRLSDFEDLGMLYDVDLSYFLSFVLSLTAWGVFIFLGLYFGSLHFSGRKKWFNIIIRVVLFASFVVSIPNIFAMQKGKLRLIQWNEQLNIRDRGRYTTVLYYSEEGERQLNYVKDAVALWKIPSETCVLRFQSKVQVKRNIHIIVMESFIDLRDVQNITYTNPPIYPEMSNFRFDHMISPVAGGNTSQSEYEILTGLPALKKLQKADFYQLEGNPVYALPSYLKARGYKTVATIGTKPVYYNSVNAYTSLGFAELHFDDGKSYLQRRSDDKWVFDGDILSQNFAYVYDKYISKGISVVNYVLGSYGHIPVFRNTELRPDRTEAKIDGEYEKEINALANQFYYRTKAIYEFLQDVKKYDRNAIVLIIGDHVSKLVHSYDFDYKYSLYHTPGVLLDAGKRVDIDGLHYYEIPYRIITRLSNEKIELPAEKDLERCYYEATATGMGLLEDKK